jgi:3-deoxy-D-manno-octulosonic-acid transferase
MMPYVLNFLYALLLVLVSPLILWRRITQGRYRQGWREKLFGLLPELPARSSATDPSQSRPPRIWFHAVSVGELQVIRPVIELAKSEWPELQVIVTTSTDSGYDLAKKLYAQHHVAFAPLDFTWAVRNALDRIDPDLVVMTEMELWPNWYRATAHRKIPIAIINARLSERSLRGYQRAARGIVPTLKQVAWIGAQSATYRDRFLILEYPETQIEVTGNIKFDGATPDREHPEVVHRRQLLSLT